MTIGLLEDERVDNSSTAGFQIGAVSITRILSRMVLGRVQNHDKNLLSSFIIWSQFWPFLLLMPKMAFHIKTPPKFDSPKKSCKTIVVISNTGLGTDFVNLLSV